jgi:PTS system fructose-specific IIC component
VKFVGVTSCPTGIAHSSMAAEAIEEAARERGHECEVEVQGASGGPAISSDKIREADAVIFAVDAGVKDRDRFAHLPHVQVRTREAIDKAPSIIERAEKAAEEAPADREAAPAADSGAEEQEMSGGERLRQWLMTGVSYMLPFVIGGGILIAAAFAIGDAVAVTEVDVFNESFSDYSALTYIGALLFTIGAQAFAMLVPILAGFIAYAMADRPGIAPGIVGGLIANEMGAGFLGAIVVGLFAGWLINVLKKTPVTGTLQRMLPILVYPIVGTLIVGLATILVIGEPIAALTEGLTSWLDGLSGANLVLLGIILGGMMAFDLGGPINKVAYGFGIAALDSGNYEVMAAIMGAGMVPPLAMALATVLRSKLYNDSEIQAGEAAWLMGASFITEGAIPFAAADPLRVIPAMMVGSATTAVLSLLGGVTLQAPHGGIWVVGLMGNALWFLVAVAVGTVISAVLVNVIKTVWKPSDAQASKEAVSIV